MNKLFGFRKVRAKFSFISCVGMIAASCYIISCNETLEVEQAEIGLGYYPTAIGQYRVYDVEEVFYRITGFDTVTYQLRETITDSIVSLDQTTYVIEREIRDNESEAWQSDSLWSVTPTSLFVAVSENSISFVKLAFPVVAGTTWNGNNLNAQPDQTYYYENVAESDFDQAPLADQIRVIIEDIPENTTGVDLRSEIYAKGIGLVEKDYFTQVKCTANCDGNFGEVEAGRLLSQKLIEYGESSE